jgi:hypothetical protein
MYPKTKSNKLGGNRGKQYNIYRNENTGHSKY